MAVIIGTRADSGLPVVYINLPAQDDFGEWVYQAKTTDNLPDLEKFAGHSNPKIRKAVAENIHCPESILITLTSDSDPDVLACVLRNPNSPEYLRAIGTLADLPVPVVWFAVGQPGYGKSYIDKVRFQKKTTTPSVIHDRSGQQALIE